MKTHRIFIFVIVLSLAVLACGTSATGGGDQSQPEAPTKVFTVTPTEVPAESFVSIPGIANINLLTDVNGVGEKPLFKWESVSGVDRYQLIVFDEVGEPYWAWTGTNTQIYMGGTDSQPPDDSDVPSIAAGYSWAVIAYSSDGKVIATSEKRPISP